VFLQNGGVAERSNAAVSKTVSGGYVRRGFKSLPLRLTSQKRLENRVWGILAGAPADAAGDGERPAPEGLNAKELLVLHDADAEKSLVLLFFDNEEDYRQGDEILSGMNPDDTPGTRTSVTRYDVAMRQTM
jgi:hypothetical protein